MKKLTRTKSSHIIIMGDFNYHIDWNIQKGETIYEQKFYECTLDCYLYQHITDHTRFRTGHQPNTLDLLFTNEEGMVKNIEYLDGLGKSDHVCIMADFDLYVEETQKATPKYKYYKGDYDSIRKDIVSIKWESELQKKSVEESWTYFSKILNTTMEKNIPKGTVSRKKS